MAGDYYASKNDTSEDAFILILQCLLKGLKHILEERNRHENFW